MKLAVVLGKNFVLKGRHWIQTALEIVVPCLLFIALVIIRSALKVDPNNEDPGARASHYTSFLDDRAGMQTFCWSLYGTTGGIVYVAPNSSEYARKFVEQFNAAGFKYCQESRWTYEEDYVGKGKDGSSKDYFQKTVHLGSNQYS